MSGDIRRNETVETFVLVRRGVPRGDVRGVLLPLDHPRNRRLRVFLAGVTVPLPFRSVIARHRTVHRSVHEKNRQAARQPTVQMDSESIVFGLPVPCSRDRNHEVHRIYRRIRSDASMAHPRGGNVPRGVLSRAFQ